MNANHEPTEEEIQKLLSGEATKGPRTFRGKTLAALSRGLRDLREKVISRDDTGAFHDVALLHILEAAHSDTDAGRLAARRALISATDDVAGFRAVVSLKMDDLSDDEIAEAGTVTDDILGIIEKAEVQIVEKKSGPAEAAPEELSPTTTL